MFKLIIIDDEDIIRRGLANVIDWEIVGFEIVGLFEDGKDAIEYLIDHPVDVVFSDVKMTFNSGIDVAKFLHEKKPEVKIVLISGYKEFELAQQALNFGVSSYLLKPSRIEEITKCFQKIRDDLIREKEQNDYHRNNETKIKAFEEKLLSAEEQLMLDIVAGRVRNPDDISQRLSFANIGNEPHKLRGCLVKIRIQFKNKEKQLYGKEGLLRFSRNILSSSSQDVKCLFLQFEGRVIKVIAIDMRSKSKEHFEDSCREIFNRLKQGIEMLMETKVEIEFTEQFNGIDELRNLNLVRQNEENVAEIAEEGGSLLREHEKHLFSVIFSGNKEKIRSEFTSFVQYFSVEGITNLQEVLINFFANINRILSNEMNGTLQNITKGKFNFSGILTLLNEKEIVSWGSEILCMLADYLSEDRNNKESSVISRAKEFIQNNYNQDISLYDVADAIYHNPAYLSRLFKEKTGENYLDYLTRVRINKANQLLKDPKYKVYEVSNLVGYKSAKYFSRLFQKYTGIKPTESR